MLKKCGVNVSRRWQWVVTVLGVVTCFAIPGFADGVARGFGYTAGIIYISVRDVVRWIAP